MDTQKTQEARPKLCVKEPLTGAPSILQTLMEPEEGYELAPPPPPSALPPPPSPPPPPLLLPLPSPLSPVPETSLGFRVWV